MSPAAADRTELRHAALAFVAALMTSIIVAGIGAYATQNVYGSRIARAEQDILANHQDLESLRDAVDHRLSLLSDAINRTSSDVSWIRGKLEGKNP